MTDTTTMDSELPSHLSAVPVFPLPRLVLFPGTRLPLHVFEPRYREMTRACLEARDPMMAVVQLKPGFEADYGGPPRDPRRRGSGPGGGPATKPGRDL